LFCSKKRKHIHTQKALIKYLRCEIEPKVVI